MNSNFAPRLGFAWGWEKNTVLRGGYGIYYDPTFFNIPLLVWQSGPISPYAATGGSALGGNITTPDVLSTFPNRPFDPEVVSNSLAPFSTVNQNTVSQDLRNPFVHSASLSLQRQFQKDFLLEVSYFGSRGTKLFQRQDLNPYGGWQMETSSSTFCNPCTRVRLLPRLQSDRGAIIGISNGALSNYHALQFSATKRLRRTGLWNGLALTGAYTWSHMTDNASEIFGPGVLQQTVKAVGKILLTKPFNIGEPFEISTPFPQNASDPRKGERGNSSFDRRHRFALSFAWESPSAGPKTARILLGNWALNGVITAQSGQPFTPVNSSVLTPGGFPDISFPLNLPGTSNGCGDAGGDGILFNDRPDIGNPNAPANTVALLNNTFCLDPNNPDAQNHPIVPGKGPYVTPDGNSVDPKNVRFVQVPIGVFGKAGRNILTGPATVNFDLSLSKSFRLGERLGLQLRADAYDLFNRQNPGAFSGNSYIAGAQVVPAVAFYPAIDVGPLAPAARDSLLTLARINGLSPENSIDTVDPASGKPLFQSQRFLTTSSRRIQLAMKLTF